MSNVKAVPGRAGGSWDPRGQPLSTGGIGVSFDGPVQRPTLMKRIELIGEVLDDLQKVSEVLSERLATVSVPAVDKLASECGGPSEPLSPAEAALDGVLTSIRYRKAFLERLTDSLRV